MDSRASGHVIGDSQNFDYLQTVSSSQGIRTAEGESYKVQGFGTSTIQTNAGEIELINVKYVQSLHKNLISVGSITNSGQHVVFTRSHCHVINEPFGTRNT
jgi:hypothetical protein